MEGGGKKETELQMTKWNAVSPTPPPKHNLE